jgi:hypothetical protein
VRDERLSVLWLCGPPGAGKSAVGWALYAGLAGSGARVAFADLDQLGMCLPAPPDDPERDRLKERNLSAVARNFRAAGCDAVIAAGDLGPSPGISSGTIPGASLVICRLRASPEELRRRLTSRREEPDFVAGALPAARVTVCRLHAGPAELARRVSSRGQGLGWPQPGDPLLGQPEARLRLFAAESAAQALALERSGLGDVRVDTDGRTAAEVADLVDRCWSARFPAGS